MSRRLRLAALGMAELLLLAWPVGEATVLLALLITADAALLLLILAPLADKRRMKRKLTVVLPFGQAGVDIALARRTIPGLRSHRPAGIIDAQVRWRRAAEANRRKREVGAVVLPSE